LTQEDSLLGDLVIEKKKGLSANVRRLKTQHEADIS
jgi:hypothetical protein